MSDTKVAINTPIIKKPAVFPITGKINKTKMPTKKVQKSKYNR